MFNIGKELEERGESNVWLQLLGIALTQLGINDPEAQKVIWVKEREEAIALLRDECARHEGVEWVDGPRLTDIINKCLLRYMVWEDDLPNKLKATEEALKVNHDMNDALRAENEQLTKELADLKQRHSGLGMYYEVAHRAKKYLHEENETLKKKLQQDQSQIEYDFKPEWLAVMEERDHAWANNERLMSQLLNMKEQVRLLSQPQLSPMELAEAKKLDQELLLWNRNLTSSALQQLTQHDKEVGDD